MFLLPVDSKAGLPFAFTRITSNTRLAAFENSPVQIKIHNRFRSLPFDFITS